jgi:hypothetical protein
VLVLPLVAARLAIADDSGVVAMTSGLAFDWLDVLEMDWVGDRPALPIVEWPSEPTEGACGY